MTVRWVDSTLSTNEDARNAQAWDVFVADSQTAGRGRLDHTWHSAPGMNLTFSAVLPDAGRTVAETATLPLVVGLAVATSVRGILEKYDADTARQVRIKWPNDILAGGKKLAGILCERTGGGIIAGIGLNVNQRSFPPGIAMRPTSLALLAGRDFDRRKVLDVVLESIESRHAEWAKAGFRAVHADISMLDCLKGKIVTVAQTDDDRDPVSGPCGGIADDGSLIVAGVRVFAGEAHVLRARG